MKSEISFPPLIPPLTRPHPHKACAQFCLAGQDIGVSKQPWLLMLLLSESGEHWVDSCAD